LGGFEGKKHRIECHLLNSEYRFSFITKEGLLSWYLPKIWNIFQLRQISQAYAFYRERGYPVPNTVRYYLDAELNQWLLLMSDLTEWGKFRIWGFSNRMTKNQKSELLNMQLNSQDIKKISSQIDVLMKKAKQDKLELLYHYYHVRQNKETREVDLYLLDIDPQISRLAVFNRLHKFVFMRILKQQMNTIL
jgi:hypothetical protein